MRFRYVTAIDGSSETIIHVAVDLVGGAAGRVDLAPPQVEAGERAVAHELRAQDAHAVVAQARVREREHGLVGRDVLLGGRHRALGTVATG